MPSPTKRKTNRRGPTSATNSRRSLTSPKTPKADVVNKHTGDFWAYSKIVRKHFFEPENLLWENPEMAKYDAEGIVGSPACLLGDTKVHTIGSEFASISELKINDKVLSHDGKHNKITRVFKPTYNGPLVELNTRLGNIVATPDHLIYGMKTNRPPSYFLSLKNILKRGIIGWHHASDFKKGDMCMYPIDRTEKIVRYIKVESARKGFDYKSKALPKRIPINAEFLELAGYFISDGYSKHGKSDVGFVFSSDQMAYAERVKTIVKQIFNLESNIKSRPKHHRIDVTVQSIHLNRLFSELFENSAKTKHIPDFMMLLPVKVQASLILGLWRGDGYFNMKRIWPRAGYSTISAQLIQQLKTLLLRQDIIPSIYREPEKTIKGVHHQKSYRIHLGEIDSLIKLSEILKIKFDAPNKPRAQHIFQDKDYAYIPVTKIGKRQFEGRLSNLEVNSAHTYVTDAFLAHNCGDVMRVWLNIDKKKDRITAFKWRTFGCASAIAATSMLSVMITEKGGMKIDRALEVRPQDIMTRLGGLPDRKIHCSVLGDKALRAAINYWFKKTKQYDRIIIEGTQVIDPNTKVTEADIEEAVLEGAITLEAVQKRTKVGVGYPECIPKVEELIRFYKEKYFGA
ncbi:MAG: iron-sulfur cluster assembly scaffold protein [Candidatus Taylorbacteria bacterium]|nr:iron-sulfur cluster assembly scaffold protein [Candidatus Taylorbacteria bacterium]